MKRAWVLWAITSSAVWMTACTSQPTQTFTPSAQRQRAMQRLQLAAAYFEQGQHEVAEQEARAAMDLDPSYAPSHNMLGLIHQRLQSPEWAKQNFEQALTLASKPGQSTADLASIQHNYGWFLCEQGQHAQGQTLLQHALSQPGYRQAVTTWVVLGDCQQRAGQQAQAQQSWQHALTLEPNNAWLKQRLASPEMQKFVPKS